MLSFYLLLFFYLLLMLSSEADYLATIKKNENRKLSAGTCRRIFGLIRSN
jgi:hypothetical protein